jgi:hypothetical protein
VRFETTRIANGILIIEPEPEGECEYCGKIDELRPYGKDGARICYDCGMKNREETDHQFGKVLDKIVPINPKNN